MSDHSPITLTRDCEAVGVPVGNQVTLQKGEQAMITQSLGGSYTVVVNGNMFRIEGKDRDALGMEVTGAADSAEATAPTTQEELQNAIWEEMKNCYDPEIPVNIVDLGLIYDTQITQLPESGEYRVDVKMTLTAPGCGMGEYIRQDVISKVENLPGVRDAHVDLVWEPTWNQEMMSEAARLQLGMM